MKKIIQISLVCAILALLAIVPTAPAATVTNTVGDGYSFAGESSGLSYVIHQTADFATYNSAASNDVQIICLIPSNTLVRKVWYKVQTVEGATLTFDIGDDNSTTQFVAAANGNALGEAVSADASARLYTANGNLRVTVNHAADAAKIQVAAECVVFRP